jgi:hypothetical protein
VRAKPSVFMMVIVAATFMACGSEEQTQSPGADGTPPDVSAALPEISESVASCLDLVEQQEYQQAIPVCTEALGGNPDNVDVQAALETSQQEVNSQGSELTEKASKEMQK